MTVTLSNITTVSVIETYAVAMTDNAEDWPGALTAQIGATISALREAQGMSVSRLAARTAELGYPMHRVAAITKIEAGERAITVPELIVIAAALNTAPLSLLAPSGPDDPVDVLPGVTMDGAGAFGWFTGTTSDVPTGAVVDRANTARLELIKRLNEIDELIFMQRVNLTQALEGPRVLSMPGELRSHMAASADHARALIQSLEIQRTEILHMLEENGADHDGR